MAVAFEVAHMDEVMIVMYKKDEEDGRWKKSEKWEEGRDC